MPRLHPTLVPTVFRIDIRKKIILIVTASIVLIAVPGGALIYAYAQRQTLQHESTLLEKVSTDVAQAVQRRFAQSEPKLAALARLLEKELARPVEAAEPAAFTQRMERNPDGIWRNRVPSFDGTHESGIFLPASAALTDAQKVQHLRIKQVMDVFGAAADTPLENIWYLSPQRSEVIFDRAYPNFVHDQKADNDYTQTPWVAATSPLENPAKTFGFTPPLFDPVPKAWMVSGVMPLYVKGQWIGSIGEDIPLTSGLQEILATSQLNLDVHHFVIDGQGNFVLAGPWQKELEASPNAFYPDLRQEPQMAALFGTTLAPTPRIVGDTVMLQGKPYLAVGTELRPMGWRYYRLTSVDEIMAHTRALFAALAAMVSLMVVCIGLLIGTAVGRNVTRRIKLLSAVMGTHATDPQARVPAALAGHDELADAALVYNAMADGMDQNIAQRLVAEATVRKSEARLQAMLDAIPDLLFELTLEGRYCDFHAPRTELLIAPIEALMGKIVAEVMPASQATIVVDALQEANVLGYSSGMQIELSVPQGQRWFELSVVRKAHQPDEELRFIVLSRDITDEKNAALHLAESEAHFRLLTEDVSDVVWKTGADNRFTYISPADERLRGFKASEMIGQPVTALFNAEGIAANARQIAEYKASRPSDERNKTMVFEVQQRRKDGGLIWTEIVSTAERNAQGQVTGFHGITRNITERKAAEDEILLAASVFTHTREGILLSRPDGSIVDVNDAFTRITGYERHEVLGQNPRMLSSGRQDKAFYAALWDDLIGQGHWVGEMWNRRKNGEVYVQMQSINAVRDAKGNTQHYVALFSDITAQKQHQSQLEHIAHYDALTNLPNRVLLADRLRHGLAQAQRRGQLLAVAFLDLDGFKEVNDQYGHEAGDHMLVTLASRMKQVLRDGDTLARMGGDEFVAVLVDLPEMAASVPLLTRLLGAAAQPVQFGDIALQVTASLGVTFYPQTESADADQMLRQADQAMYQAKQAGKNRYHVFDAEQDRSIRGHHESIERIRRALLQREFVLHFQPKVNMRTGVVVGVEALIRWQHPDRGLLSPAVFLPVIEEHPLAIDVGEWVIDSALAHIAQWQSQGLHMPVSVNIGARQLQQANFVERLRESFARHPGVDPRDLELEVLETSALEDVAGVSLTIESCREMGVMFALDDFGTGYSSLTYLKRLPVALLKIDQSFVHDMLDDPDDLAILEGVIGLAAAFRRQVIAEGVESVEHGAMLLQLGCELAQGYGIARPMPAPALAPWLASWKPDASWGNQHLVSRRDLPMLFASVEHRSWIKAMDGYLSGERASPPALDHRQCHFGQWMSSDGRDRYGAYARFATIDQLHQQAHRLAAELCALKEQGQGPLALARLDALHGLGNAMLKEVQALTHESREPQGQPSETD